MVLLIPLLGYTHDGMACLIDRCLVPKSPTESLPGMEKDWVGFYHCARVWWKQFRKIRSEISPKSHSSSHTPQYTSRNAQGIHPSEEWGTAYKLRVVFVSPIRGMNGNPQKPPLLRESKTWKIFNRLGTNLCKNFYSGNKMRKFNCNDQSGPISGFSIR
jgi:hypothetical protein